MLEPRLVRRDLVLLVVSELRNVTVVATGAKVGLLDGRAALFAQGDGDCSVHPVLGDLLSTQ